jgi:hypothetical protein
MEEKDGRNKNIHTDWKQTYRFSRKTFFIAQDTEHPEALSMIVWFQIWNF